MSTQHTHKLITGTRATADPIESDQRKGLPQPPLTWLPESILHIVDLPNPAALDVEPVVLRALIEQRDTIRHYHDMPLSLAELSYLLWCTQGIKMITSHPVTLRTVPSAGACHAFETFLLINRVEGVEPGLYVYLAHDHQLAAVDLAEAVAEDVYRACLDQSQVLESAVTFIWAAVAYRMIYRYPERGYRYLLLDAGHVCQNLYLAAESIDCGVCAIGAFHDDLLNDLLGIDGDEMFAIYAATLGKQAR